MTHPLAALLKDVPRYQRDTIGEMQQAPDGPYAFWDEVLAALEAATPPDLTGSVTVHANMLRGTIAKPTVDQIIHLYGREAFQPMIDAAVAKALEDACLAVSEHADWPEDEHGRTEQAGLFARVINAICAIAPAAPHVNETSKSEHDAGNVLTVPDLVEAGKVLAKLQSQIGDDVQDVYLPEALHKLSADTITALIALATAQAAQIAGLQDPVAVHANMLRGTIAKPTLEQVIHLYGRDALVKALEATERPNSPAHIVEYTNWRGETARRVIIPIRFWWGSTEWHPEEQWMLSAWDVEKDARRDFAWQDMRPVQNPATSSAIATLRAEVERLRGALRLIELIGYREGEDFGWINAHMRGVATSILSDQSIDHYWRLFPNHRAALEGKHE